LNVARSEISADIDKYQSHGIRIWGTCVKRPHVISGPDCLLLFFFPRSI